MSKNKCDGLALYLSNRQAASNQHALLGQAHTVTNLENIMSWKNAMYKNRLFFCEIHLIVLHHINTDIRTAINHNKVSFHQYMQHVSVMVVYTTKACSIY